MNTHDPMGRVATPTALEQVSSLYQVQSPGCYLDDKGALYRVKEHVGTTPASIRYIRLATSRKNQSLFLTEILTSGGRVSFETAFVYLKASSDPDASIDEIVANLQAAGVREQLILAAMDLEAMSDSAEDMQEFAG